MDRLRGFLAALTADGPSKPSDRGCLPWSPGVAAVLFIGGFAAGRFAPQWQPQPEASENQDDWRHAVAQYMALYTADTLSDEPTDAASQAASLKSLGERLGTALNPERIAVAGLPFKRSQLLSYDKAPLGQLAYLDPQAGPVLFCIIADSRPNARVSNAVIDGFATSSWAKEDAGLWSSDACRRRKRRRSPASSCNAFNQPGRNYARSERIK